MKNRFAALGLLAAIPLQCAFADGATANSSFKLESESDRVSYSMGINIGSNLRQQDFKLNADAFKQGFTTGYTDQPGLMTEEEVVNTLVKFQQEFIEQKMQAAKKSAEINQKESAAFLEKNKKAKGIKVTASGLQYRILTAGKGPIPTLSDTVTTHYRGKLIDGTEFDSSYSRNEPATFPVEGVIPGWTEALQSMPVGSKWELFIPAELAYGDQGAGNRIGPNQALIFEIELLSIEKAPAEQAKTEPVQPTGKK